MRKAAKAQKQLQVEADTQMQAWLVSVGATRREDKYTLGPCSGNNWPIACPEFVLNTKAGVLHVLPASSLQEYGYVLYCQFQDVQLAKLVIPTGGFNSFSGKWNHSYDQRLSPESAVNNFTSILRTVLLN